MHVHDLRYFGNQPWPFTDTQMVGFFAEGDPDAIRNNPRVIEAYLGEDVSNHA